MKTKSIKYCIVPCLLFLVAILSLAYSNLTISKAIEIQNEVFEIFINTISEKDVLFAVIDSLKYVFYEIILPLLLPLLLASLGFLTLFIFREKIELKIFLGIQTIFPVIGIILTNFSIIMILAYVGIFIASILLIKKFVPVKSNFSTADSLVSKGLHWINVFLAIGFFLTLYLNFQSYQGTILKSNIDLINMFTPEMTQIQTMESGIVNRTADGLEQSVTEEYQKVEPMARQQCVAVYDAVIVGIENFKEEAAEKIKSEEGMSEEQIQEFITSSFPIVDQFMKATPLFLAIMFFALLEFIKPFISAFLGAIYTIAYRFKK